MYIGKNYSETHNPNFTRLYYKTDKEKINSILDRLPDKYINNLIKIYHELNDKNQNHSVMVRYGGFEFYASWNNLAKRIPSLYNAHKNNYKFWEFVRNGMSYSDAYKKVYGKYF